MGPVSGYWPPKLLSLRDDTPLLALPDRVELLPPSADCGLVGEPGMGWRGDCGEGEIGREGGRESGRERGLIPWTYFS